LQTRAVPLALAATSGILLALSFPHYGHPAVAWIALVPLLVALSGASPIPLAIPSPIRNPPPPIRSPQSPSRERKARPLRDALGLGLLTGAVFFLGTLYWITGVMAVYGGLPTPVAVGINTLLILYQALFVAIFAVVVRRLTIAYGSTALLSAPLVWVTIEMGRTYVLTGFPWVLLGYSQASVLPIAQLASIFGVYGVSMLVAAVNAALAMTVAHRPPAPAYRYAPIAVALSMVIGVGVWGSRRAASAPWTRQGDPIRVGLIQGNVQQDQKWDATRASDIFTDYLKKSRQAIAQGAEFVLWPESAAPFLFNEDIPAAERIRTLAREARVPILVGSDEVEWRTNDRGRVPDKFFNSAFLVRADGTTAGVYRKMHLVPFGEYVPWQNLLFFAAPLTEQVGTFAPGVDPQLLPVNGHPVSVAICYEVVYPDQVRRFVAGGSEMLTTITNDAWFGRTSAPYQHFEQAAMRAIENGRYLVRSANTGISGIVDPYGRVVEKTDIFQSAVLVGEARFLTTTTFYARHGDVLAYASIIATVGLLLSGRTRAGALTGRMV
jgi:apolipoprotein N-acyltransferase